MYMHTLHSHESNSLVLCEGAGYCDQKKVTPTSCMLLELSHMENQESTNLDQGPYSSFFGSVEQETKPCAS